MHPWQIWRMPDSSSIFITITHSYVLVNIHRVKSAIKRGPYLFYDFHSNLLITQLALTFMPSDSRATFLDPYMKCFAVTSEPVLVYTAN